MERAIDGNGYNNGETDKAADCPSGSAGNGASVPCCFSPVALICNRARKYLPPAVRHLLRQSNLAIERNFRTLFATIQAQIKGVCLSGGAHQRTATCL